MRLHKVVFVAVLACALAVSGGLVAVLGQTPVPAQKRASPARVSAFAALKGVTAKPLRAGELRTVKGLHIHFTTPSQNEGHPLVEPFTGWHFVNHTENNLGLGQANPGSGPGYSGLCGAALLSPAITIPGQNPTTGVGGGC